MADNSSVVADMSSGREFIPVDVMPGGSMKIVKENPTSAFVRFKAGSVEPANRHNFGMELVMLKGKKRVWNVSKNERFDLTTGDYVFTPAGDVQRALYIEDTEFFAKWEGKWEMFVDEDVESAKNAIAGQGAE